MRKTRVKVDNSYRNVLVLCNLSAKLDEPYEGSITIDQDDVSVCHDISCQTPLRDQDDVSVS